MPPDSGPAEVAARAGSAEFNLPQVVRELRQVRELWRGGPHHAREISGRELPSRDVLAEIIAALRGALFPMRLGPADIRPESEDYYVGNTLHTALAALLTQVRLELRYLARKGFGSTGGVDESALVVVRRFAASLPSIRVLLDSDVVAAYNGDPAAHSTEEVLLCYPGVQAMIHHRIAHELYRLGVPLLARMVAEIAHGETGIDIHPGATIGAGFFIDHGTGVVIGETAQIGRDVRLYQAVTLGAKRFASDGNGRLQKGGARHPIVEDGVVIYAGATILGRVTIGRDSVIGGNVWLTRSVPAGSHVAQAQTREGVRDEDFASGSGI